MEGAGLDLGALLQPSRSNVIGGRLKPDTTDIASLGLDLLIKWHCQGSLGQLQCLPLIVELGTPGHCCSQRKQIVCQSWDVLDILQSEGVLSSVLEGYLACPLPDLGSLQYCIVAKSDVVRRRGLLQLSHTLQRSLHMGGGTSVSNP